MKIWAAAAALLSAAPSSAADITVLPFDAEFAQIILEGEIVAGDDTKFFEAAKPWPRASVVLLSPGGLVAEALSIGSEIRLRGFSTMVPSGDGCYSACALIWSAGVRRYMMPDAVIGVHAAYETIKGRDGKSEPRESGVSNAQIGAYLNTLGFTAKAIAFFTIAGPDEMQILTPAVAQVLDIDLFIQDGLEVITPEERPTPRRIAEQATRIFAVSVRCGDILGLDAEAVRAQGVELLKGGHDLFGGEMFVHLIPEYAERWKQETAQMKDPGWCLQSAEILEAEGHAVVGLSSPSFDCGRAGTVSERTICEAPSLWARDRVLAWAYGALRDHLESDVFEQVRADQRGWLARREACGTNITCKERVYDARLREIGVM